MLITITPTTVWLTLGYFPSPSRFAIYFTNVPRSLTFSFVVPVCLLLHHLIHLLPVLSTSPTLFAFSICLFAASFSSPYILEPVCSGELWHRYVGIATFRALCFSFMPRISASLLTCICACKAK